MATASQFFLSSVALSDPTTEPPRRGASFPRIAMLWSPAAQKGDRWVNMAQHDLILVGPEDLGLEWSPNPFPNLSTTLTETSKIKAREAVAKLRRLNPRAQVLCELYFFEANDGSYPPESSWWLRDKAGQREQFWPGCHSMDISRDDYVVHVATRAAAVYQALDGQAGIFLDNLRGDEASRLGWSKLISLIRKQCSDVPILVNAGWDSDDLEWIAPLVNGLMYEDSVSHIKNKDAESFYARIARTDGLLRSPRISVNEHFGKRSNEQAMRRELIRTLVYTDMYYLYADSTQGHKHDWWPIWNSSLGHPVAAPAVPARGQLAQRKFEAGLVLWLPADAKTSVTMRLPLRMKNASTLKTSENVTLAPGEGMIFVDETKPAATQIGNPR